MWSNEIFESAGEVVVIKSVNKTLKKAAEGGAVIVIPFLKIARRKLRFLWNLAHEKKKS